MSDFLTRAEFDTKFDSLRGELNAKLDTLIQNKTQDAHAMGCLQEQVRRLAEDVKAQGREIGELRRLQNAPKDTALRLVASFAKGVALLVAGYLLKKFGG